MDLRFPSVTNVNPAIFGRVEAIRAKLNTRFEVVRDRCPYHQPLRGFLLCCDTGFTPLASLDIPPSLVASENESGFIGMEDRRGAIMPGQHINCELTPPKSRL
jgi:hypothetical protein